MKLTTFSDYTLRVLMFLAIERERLSTIPEIAAAYGISENHLTKVVHQLVRSGIIESVRGKGGGIRLNPEALQLRLGQAVRILQRETPIVECNTPPCVLRSNCGLKGILDHALEQFYQSLDQYTLADVLSAPASSKYSAHSPIQLINL